ncbi:putative membrane protein YjbE [Collibacillus ludicampi]|uniref:Membrane protein YjbE n=1 Tax=Collibacillus ludicampi TaxID=2771369 RepID=A0AAV4LHL1_9BACL|nr:TerC family protein [Collibacillus ludicampi]GIM47331.1 putative membrane protein YjbE [Collibacillus ludicampi]
MEQTWVLLQILLINVVLSADNALVISLATRNLRPSLQKRATMWGALGAVLIRFALTGTAVYFLRVPYLQVIGGIFLLILAYKLLRENKEEQHVIEARGVRQAIRAIILADLIMSFDNVIAIAGIARGDLLLLLTGISISVPIIVYGSKLVSYLLNKYPVLLYAGVAVLGWTGGLMILEDQAMIRWTEQMQVLKSAMPWISVIATSLAVFRGRFI